MHKGVPMPQEVRDRISATLGGNPVIGGQKKCTGCGEEKPLSGFSLRATKSGRETARAQCRACQSHSNSGRWASDVRHDPKAREQNRLSKRRARLRAVFGITEDDYGAMMTAQDGRCAICGTTKPGGRFVQLLVDHCHETGQIRGLLCSPCNTILGMSKDDAERLRNAADYLERESPWPVAPVSRPPERQP